MAKNYYPLISRAARAAELQQEGSRFAAYDRARNAQKKALQSFSKAEALEEELALEEAILEVEMTEQETRFINDEDHEGWWDRAFLTPRRNSSLLVKILYALARYALCIAFFFVWFIFPAVAPKSLVPQWLLDHPSILLGWCILFTLGFTGILCLFAKSTQEIFQTNKDSSKKYIALHYPWFIPLVIATALFPIAGVLYNLGNLSGYYNPFGHPFSFFDSYLFFVDQALRGTLSSVSDLFDVRLKNTLEFNAWDHLIFWSIISAYRFLVSFIGIGTIFLILRWLIIRWILSPLWRLIVRFNNWSMERNKRQRERYKLWFPLLRPYFDWVDRLVERRTNRLAQQWNFLSPILAHPGTFLASVPDTEGTENSSS